MTNVYESTVEFLRQRQTAYRLVFKKPAKFFTSIKKCYHYVFDLRQPATIEVLIDMARFCRANESCVVPGDRDRTLVLEGRREMFLRIQHHLGLTTEQVFALYSGNSPQQRN